MVLPHLFGNGETNDENFIEMYSFLQTALEPDEYLRATILIGKIITNDSFDDLSDDELHLLAKILKVKNKKVPFEILSLWMNLDHVFSSENIERNLLFRRKIRFTFRFQFHIY